MGGVGRFGAGYTAGMGQEKFPCLDCGEPVPWTDRRRRGPRCFAHGLERGQRIMLEMHELGVRHREEDRRLCQERGIVMPPPLEEDPEATGRSLAARARYAHRERLSP